MIQREVDNGICLLTFDRPESGANIFDAATMADLEQQLDAIEQDDSLGGVVILSAKKSIFIAGADLKTLLRQAQTDAAMQMLLEMPAFQLDLPSGSQHRTVYSFRIGDS